MSDITTPVKPISEIEEKAEVSENDKILILDSVSEEARLASKDELKWDKGDKWDKWDTWSQWPQWAKWDKWDQWLQWPQGETWAKWDKGDKGDKWETWATWQRWPQWVKWDKGDKGDKGDTGASIVSATFVDDDIYFTRSDSTVVILEDAKEELKGDKWDTWDEWPQWEQWPQWETWDTWATWASIVSAAFSGDDIVFTKDDSNTVTLANAKDELKWDTGNAATVAVWSTTTGNPWTDASVTNSWSSSAAVLNFTIPKWATWETWNWIASVTSSKSWKITTVTITETDGDSNSFQISDWEDWEWAWDVLWPNSSTDWNVVLFDWVTWKLIKDWWAFSAANIWALPSSTKYWASITVSVDTTDYKITTTLKDQDWNTLGTAQVIDLPLESVVVSGSYDSQTKKIILTLQNGNTIEFSVADLVSWLQSEITSSNKLDADLVDDSTSTNKFVTASNKTTWDWKQDKLIAWTNIQIAADWKTISSTDTTYSAASSSSLWLVKLWSDTVQSVAANAVTWTAWKTYALQVNSSWQLVVNIPRTDTTYTASSFDIKDLTDSTWLRTTWSWKQDALSSQTAYSSKWTATKVPTITTNSLWQVTWITETNIDFPVTSVNWSTWAVTGLQTTSNLKTNLTDNSDSYYPSQKAVKTAVDSKQDTLVNQTNIKSINWNSLLGSGDLGLYSATTATLASANWSSKSITVSVSWVTASNTIIVSPAPSSLEDRADASIYCSAQSSWSLTFECDTEPTSNITVNVLILN